MHSLIAHFFPLFPAAFLAGVLAAGFAALAGFAAFLAGASFFTALLAPFTAFWIFFVFGAAAAFLAGFSFLAGVGFAFGWVFSFGSDLASVSVFTGAGSGVGAFWAAFDFSAFLALAFSS